MSESEIFKEIHSQLLDFLENRVALTTNWGLDVYSKIKEANLELVSADSEKQSAFIYAVTTAVIIGEFSKRGYEDYFCDTTEIDLYALDLSLDDIQGFVNWEILPERRTELQEQYCVNLQDMWRSICVYKTNIHDSLTKIYSCKEREPKVYMFKSLNAVLGESAFLETLNTRTHNAYQYIENRFRY